MKRNRKKLIFSPNRHLASFYRTSRCWPFFLLDYTATQGKDQGWRKKVKQFSLILGRMAREREREQMSPPNSFLRSRWRPRRGCSRVPVHADAACGGTRAARAWLAGPGRHAIGNKPLACDSGLRVSSAHSWWAWPLNFGLQ